MGEKEREKKEGEGWLGEEVLEPFLLGRNCYKILKIFVRELVFDGLTEIGEG